MKSKQQDATHYEDPAPKMAEDRELYGGTGPDGDNGNGAMTAAESIGGGEGTMRKTGDGSGHWSKH